MSAQRFSFGHYLATIGASNFALGLFSVIYPWLIIGVLQESPSRLGLARVLAVFVVCALFASYWNTRQRNTN